MVNNPAELAAKQRELVHVILRFERYCQRIAAPFSHFPQVKVLFLGALYKKV